MPWDRQENIHWSQEEKCYEGKVGLIFYFLSLLYGGGSAGQIITFFSLSIEMNFNFSCIGGNPPWDNSCTPGVPSTTYIWWWLFNIHVRISWWVGSQHCLWAADITYGWSKYCVAIIFSFFDKFLISFFLTFQRGKTLFQKVLKYCCRL